MDSCAILIDANVALHFPPIDQIDWLGIARTSSCIVVVTPILLRELEHQKIFSRSASLRERADKRIDFLVRKMADPDSIPLRPNVELRFVDHEPAIDFSAHQLVREVQDDHYIASALTFARDSGLTTFVASNDGGMALKLRARPIRVLRLPDELRLSPELDPDQKELRDARLQIARMQSQRPKLVVRFPGGDAHRTIRNSTSPSTDLPSVTQIQAEHPLFPIPTDKATPLNGDLASIGNLRGLYGMGSVASLEQHNAALVQFYGDYGRYLDAMSEWLERLRLTTNFEVELCNEGSATATFIDVTLRFPSTVKVLRTRDWPREPKAPVPPQRSNITSHLYEPGGEYEIPRLLSSDFTLYDGAVHIDEEGSLVEFSAKALKQKCTLRAERFLIVRDAGLTDSGIEIEVIITFHEGEPISHKLSVAFSEVVPEESDD